MNFSVAIDDDCVDSIQALDQRDTFLRAEYENSSR